MGKEVKIFLGAIVLAAIGFLFLLSIQNIWFGLFFAELVGVVYIIRLLVISKKLSESELAFRITFGLVLIVILVNSTWSITQYNRRDYQKNLLLDIRKTIGIGVAKADVQKDLTYVLGQYHLNEKTSIIESARELIAEKLGENGVYISNDDLRYMKEKGNSNWDGNDDTNYFYEIDEDEDQIKVFVISEIALGEHTDYQNYDRQIGKYEMVFTLNKEGVKYEVLN